LFYNEVIHLFERSFYAILDNKVSQILHFVVKQYQIGSEIRDWEPLGLFITLSPFECTKCVLFNNVNTYPSYVTQVGEEKKQQNNADW
jgi:hypothetical protein